MNLMVDWFVGSFFYRISALAHYLLPNPIYIYVCVCVCVCVCDLVWLGFMAYQPFWLFNAKSSLYIVGYHPPFTTQ